MCPSLIQIGLKTAEKTLHKQTNIQTNKQTNRHYDNNGHLAVNEQLISMYILMLVYFTRILCIFMSIVCVIEGGISLLNLLVLYRFLSLNLSYTCLYLYVCRVCKI